MCMRVLKLAMPIEPNNLKKVPKPRRKPKSEGQIDALQQERERETIERSKRVKARRAHGLDDDEQAHLVDITPFNRHFCFHYVRCPVASLAYKAALINEGVELDLEGYTVKDGKIYTARELLVTEDEICHARGMWLLGYREIKQEIARIRAEIAAAVNVTADLIAGEIDAVIEQSMRLGQPHVALNAIQAKAKMFGVDATTQTPESLAPVAVNINVRDCSNPQRNAE